MSGNEAIVKVVGLLVLGGIASKVLTVIAPRAAAAIPSTRVLADSVSDAVATVGKRAADKAVSSASGN